MSTAVFFASNTKAKLNKKSRTTISKLIAVNTNTITLDWILMEYSKIARMKDC